MIGAVSQSLNTMLFGMCGIFIVMGVISLSIAALKKKKKK